MTKVEIPVTFDEVTCIYCHESFEVKSNDWWYKHLDTCICKNKACIDKMQDEDWCNCLI